MTNIRYDFIDIAKGFGILSVVWAHILLVGWTHKIIYAFHMPLFFFISGFLFNKSKYPSFHSFISKRFKRLIIPYLIYSFVTWGVWALFRYVRGDEVKSYIMPLLQTFIAQGSGSHLVHNSVLWFIPCLLAVEIMYFHIQKFGIQIATIICFSIAGLGIIMAHCWGKTYLDNMPWNLDAAFFALPFYCIGNILRKYNLYSKIDKVLPVISKVLLLLILGIILLVFSLEFGESSMGSSSYQCHELIFIFRAFIGIAALMMLALLLSQIEMYGSKKILDGIRWCGIYSLEIMCIHIPIKGIIIIIITKLLKTKVEVSTSFTYSFISFFITMCVVIFIICFIIKKLMIKNKQYYLKYEKCHHRQTV